MTKVMEFDENLSLLIDRLYNTPDVVEQRNATLRMLNLQPGEVVLDIGSGPGIMAQEIANRVGEAGTVYGVDISDDMLAIAEQRCADLLNVEFQKADALSLPFDDNYFDVVVSTQVYEYVDNIDLALDELYRVLKPGGRVLILDTDWDSSVWHTSNRERMHRIIDVWNRHCPHPFLPRTLATRLQTAGLKVVQNTIIPIMNRGYNQKNTYSYIAIDLIRDYAAKQLDVSDDELDAWVHELHQHEEDGSYFFSINRYVFIAYKL